MSDHEHEAHVAESVALEEARALLMRWWSGAEPGSHGHVVSVGSLELYEKTMDALGIARCEQCGGSGEAEAIDEPCSKCQGSGAVLLSGTRS